MSFTSGLPQNAAKPSGVDVNYSDEKCQLPANCRKITVKPGGGGSKIVFMKNASYQQITAALLRNPAAAAKCDFDKYNSIAIIVMNYIEET